MIFTVARYKYTDEFTRGLLYAGGNHIGYTMEDPWNNNENNVSCIPVGTYDTDVRPAKDSPSRNYDHMILRDVPARSYILWHVGNDEQDTEGCILPGKTAHEDMVGHSQKAFNKMMSIAKEAESITTKITDVILA